MMVSWSVRFLIFGGLGGGMLERHYCDKAKEISKGSIKSIKDLLNSMSGIVPNDSQFSASFETATVSKSHLARYYLRVLENEAKGDKAPELVPNENADIVNLEHILPISPSANWSQFSGEDHSAYARRIGNLTLLKTKPNSDLQDASFNEKKKLYKASEYSITNSISAFTEWNIEQINERQKWLSELAVKAWPNK
jgi:hypothetical protein